MLIWLAKDGLCRTDHHLAIAQQQAKPDRTPQEIGTSHMRRLEALRRGDRPRISPANRAPNPPHRCNLA